LLQSFTDAALSEELGNNFDYRYPSLRKHLLKKRKQNSDPLEIRFSFLGKENFSEKRAKKTFSNSNP